MHCADNIQTPVSLVGTLRKPFDAQRRWRTVTFGVTQKLPIRNRIEKPNMYSGMNDNSNTLPQQKLSLDAKHRYESLPVVDFEIIE